MGNLVAASVKANTRWHSRGGNGRRDGEKERADVCCNKSDEEGNQTQDAAPEKGAGLGCEQGRQVRGLQGQPGRRRKRRQRPEGQRGREVVALAEGHSPTCAPWGRRWEGRRLGPLHRKVIQMLPVSLSFTESPLVLYGFPQTPLIWGFERHCLKYGSFWLNSMNLFL